MGRRRTHDPSLTAGLTWASFRGYRSVAGAVGGKGLFERPPGEGGAFDALGEFPDALKELHVAKDFGGFVFVMGEQMMKSGKERGDLFAGFAFGFEGHHGGRGLTDGAALTGEFDVFNAAVVGKFDEELDFIAAGRIVAMHLNDRWRNFPEVPWSTRMVENDLLIKIFEVGIQGRLRFEI